MLKDDCVVLSDAPCYALLCVLRMLRVSKVCIKHSLTAATITAAYCKIASSIAVINSSIKQMHANAHVYD